MPVEIRELIIKTEVTSSRKEPITVPGTPERNALKRELLAECIREVKSHLRKHRFNR